jgi:pimeloyl-ACP methyl ester carboxylesterase
MTSIGNPAARSRLLEGVDVSPRLEAIHGVRTSLLEAGRGETLVLLHGGIECGGVYWSPVCTALAGRYRILVPDVPGLGESAPAAAFGYQAFADWFTALLRMTCPEPPTVVAHSLLGTYAARFAADHSDMLRRLVVYGAPGVGRYVMPIGLLLTAIRFGVRPSAANLQRFERWAFLDVSAIARRDAEWLEAFRAYSLSLAALPHVKQTMRRLIARGTRRISDAQLGRITVPTALLWGRYDRMAPLPLGVGASARLGWPLHVVEYVGHVPHVERPEVFVTTLIDALHRLA